MAHLPADALIFVLVAVALGTAIQAALGFGGGLLVVPALALVRPEAVPVTALLLGIPMTVAMAYRERSHIDLRGFASITAGGVLGTLAGVWILLAVPARSLSLVLGALILVAVALSASGLHIEPHLATTFGAGFVSGVMGTTSGIGGPPLAIVYQRRPGPELRSTLALSFLVGLGMSLGALLVAGKVRGWHAIFAAQLLPGLAVGLWAGRWLARTLDGRRLRQGVLIFAAIAGVIIEVRGLVGD